MIGHLDNERKGLREQLATVTDALREARMSQSSVISERSEMMSDRRPASKAPADGPALARQMSRQGEVEVTPAKEPSRPQGVEQGYAYPGGRRAVTDVTTQNIWQVLALKSYLHSTRMLSPGQAARLSEETGNDFCIAGHRLGRVALANMIATYALGLNCDTAVKTRLRKQRAYSQGDALRPKAGRSRGR